MSEARGSVDAIPERLGDFRLIERLGAGGMGVVWRARQESLQRDVALKLIRPEMLYFADARERFRREVEAVARLNHPGIVPVHTVGEENGVPHFAMELVEGASLSAVIEHLRGRRALDLSAADLRTAIEAKTRRFGARSASSTRVDAFAGTWVQACCRIVLQVAEALQHAHELGVLHRDVKPSNIVVTESGRAMLLDFGLAISSEASHITRTGTAMGSLPYMPAETLRSGSGATDQRSDVYSLGVTLFELLTLRLPFERATVQATIAAITSADGPPLAALNPAIPWDAATVCATAMERDPARRYATAADLARDLRNLLELRPIEARRASRSLRARRWVQRHPTASVAIALGFLLLVVAPSLAFWRIREERDVALRELHTKEGMLEFVLNIIGGADSSLGNPGDRTVKEVVDNATELLHGKLHEDLGSRAQLLNYLSAIQSQLGRPQESAALAREALECGRQAWGERSVHVARAKHELASSLVSLGELEEAEQLFREVIETLQGASGDEGELVIDSRIGLANIRILDGRIDEGEALLNQVSAEPSWASAPFILHVCWLGSMAQVCRLRAEFERAREYQVELLELLRQEYGESHVEVADALQNLAVTENEMGSPEEALKLLLQARDVYARLDAHDSIESARLEFNLGFARSALGQLEESAQHFGEALVICRELSGDSKQTARALIGMGAAYCKLGRYDEAETHLREAAELGRRFLPERGMQSMEVPLWLGRTLAKQGRHAEAAEHYAELLRRLDGDPGIVPELLAKYVGEYADELEALGRTAEAAQHREKQQEILASVPAQ